ncbi:MAG: lysostaphin resistance A-like protein [Roseinatronobacter sp.]
MYSPLVFDAYVAPARLRPQLWRLILGIALIVMIYVAWMLGIGTLVALWMGLEALDAQLSTMGLGREPAALIVLLFTFIGMALGTFATTAWIHKRKIATLFGPRAAVIRDFGLGAALLFAVSAPVAVLLLATVDIAPGVVLTTWLAFLPFALLGLLIQTGAEEILFRAYLQQQLAARFATRWVWMVGPSVLFGLVHYAPAEAGPNAWMLVLATGFFGLLLADLTARSGNIGLAWGLHFANNVMAMLIFTTGEALDGLALFRLPFGVSNMGAMGWIVALDIAGMVLVWWIARQMLRRR